MVSLVLWFRRFLVGVFILFVLASGWFSVVAGIVWLLFFGICRLGCIAGLALGVLISFGRALLDEVALGPEIVVGVFATTCLVVVEGFWRGLDPVEVLEVCVVPL